MNQSLFHFSNNVDGHQFIRTSPKIKVEKIDIYCSDITNNRFGISGGTVPGGGNLHFFSCVQSCHLVSGGSNMYLGQVCHHTPPLPGGVGYQQQF